MHHDTLDKLALGLEQFKRDVGEVPGLIKACMQQATCAHGLGYPALWWQADIDAAFRRIPVHREDRWACGVAFLHKGTVSGHARGGMSHGRTVLHLL